MENLRRKPAHLRRALLDWFSHHQRALPWRQTRDPYAIWVSEVMLQQTQVATVIPYWHRFLERFPTVSALAAAELPDVFALWRGLGYYSRARNLHRAAQEIVRRHQGRLPRTAPELLELPGFGRYTAGAVASIAFGEPAPLVDGNVARVFSRLFAVEGPPGDRAREAALWALAEKWVQGERPGDWNQALMELGATVCRAARPDCGTCPLRAHCGAHRADRVDALPPPKVRAPKKHLRLAVAVCRRQETFLLARRREGGLFGGLWELPCAELPAPADPAAALCGLLGKVKVGHALGEVRRTLTHRELSLQLFSVAGARPRAVRGGVQEWRWATLAEAGTLGMSTAMQKALALAAAAAPRSAADGSVPRRPAGPARRKGNTPSP
jgi:A/G-specific adenine glycosylase